MTKVIAVGHRGTAIGVPENSLLSHDTAHSMGARGIEFDIRPTKDNEFVVFHDDTLDRTTNGKGPVKDKTLDELKALRLTHDGEVTDQKIPTLREALENVRGRFMVDIDFKSAGENSTEILNQVLSDAGFDADNAPLVTIFCRDKQTFNQLKLLNNTYALRPLYIDKKQAKRVAGENARVMGLRNHQLTEKRATRIRGLEMHLFSNTMKYNALDLLLEFLGFKVKGKKPKPGKLEKYYREATENGALFVQTDYLNDLVKFLKDKDLYQDKVLNRNFEPISPPENADEEQDDEEGGLTG